MKKSLTVEVKGPPRSGKTTVAALIGKMLSDRGATVTFVDQDGHTAVKNAMLTLENKAGIVKGMNILVETRKEDD